MKRGWKNYLLYFGGTLAAGIFIYYLIQVILSGYPIPWTGFGDYTTPNGDYFREKTLWDWMELLIIPVVLAGGAIFLNRSERALERKTAEDRAKLERDLATDRQQEAALQTYFDRMSELLLKEKLRTTENVEVRDVARTRTISIMRGLDTKRNNLILQFLIEAKLITDEQSIFNRANMSGMNLQGAYLQEAILRDANLVGAILRDAYLWSAYLQEANLRDANLVGAILKDANLWGAYLVDANLQNANLWSANLQGANLFSANLQDANLISANLQGANLWEANLQGANLWEAKNITDEQLASVKSVKGATMPDGTKHE